MLTDKHIMLYVTGSVAAYKAITLMRLLQKAGAKVRIVMTVGAEEFIQPLTFEALSHETVLLNDTSGVNGKKITHIEAAQWSDIAIVVPATANFIAKVSNGIADDLALTMMLATDSLKIVVPAMNDKMWLNPAVQRNVKQLENDNINVFLPTSGNLAEGYSGIGRMLEPAEIITKLKLLLIKNEPRTGRLVNKNVLVTAAGTRERIDPVRFIANDSSGKMGYAVAQAAVNEGANVTLISGPSNLVPPVGVNLIQVVSTADLEEAVLHQFPKNDILIMAAAVADFMVSNSQPQKIKKQPGQTTVDIKFKLAPDILKEVAGVKKVNQYTVGFAAETNDLMANSQKKLAGKDLDLLVANDVSNSRIGFNSDDNQVTFLKPHQKPIKTKIYSKHKIAQLLLNQVISDLERRR